MKKKTLLTMAATLAASLLIPGTAQAASLFNGGTTTITKDSTDNTGTPCNDKDGCSGHDFTGELSTIFVESGTHILNFKDVTIDKQHIINQEGTDALSINSGATVKLVLEGTNTLIGGGNTPGIIVPKDATLEISAKTKDAQLMASTADAPGLVGAAGIGGGSTESSKKIGTIIINSGNIIATGQGSGNFPGIGTNNSSSGNIIINGGIISTKPNTDGTSYGKAIQGGQITSDTGHFSIVKGAIQGNTKGLNTLSCTSKTEDHFTVYGDIVIENQSSGGIDWVNNVEQINIQSGASLTLPGVDQWQSNCNTNSDGNLVFSGKGDIVIDPVDNSLTPSDFDKLAELGIHRKVPLILDDFKKWDVAHDVYDGYYSPEYTGADLTTSIVIVQPKRRTGSGAGMETESLTGYTMNVVKKDTGTPAELINAGTYVITLKKQNHELVLDPISIRQRDLKNITVEIPNQTYTGDPLTPNVSATYKTVGGKKEPLPFILNNDYLMAPVSNFINAGTYDITFTGTPTGNFSGKTTGSFTIDPAPIKKEDVSITVDGKDILDEEPETFTYDANSKKVDIKLTHDGKDLVLGKDYTVTYATNSGETDDPQKADLTNAGTVKMLIKGQGNYKDTVEFSFKIEKKKIELQEVTAKSRTYNGTDIVDIEAVTIREKDLIESDKGKVSINPKATNDSPALTARIERADVGSYEKLTFNAADINAKLSGDKSGNYTFGEDKNEQFTFNLVPDKKVVISTAFLSDDLKPELLGLTDNIYKADKNYEFFEYTAKVSNPIKDLQFGQKIEYEYQIDDRGWQDSPNFKELEPGIPHTFYVRTKAVWPKDETSFEKPDERANIAPSKSGKLEIPFNRLKQEAPEIPYLTFEQNEGSPTFTATINLNKKVPDIPGVEYSFSGKDDDFSDTPTKDHCTSGTEYIGYIRYKETKTHLPGEIAQSKPAIAPQLKVSKPVITPGSKSFLQGDSIEITMSCDTENAKIYYTMDGKEPIPGNSNTILYDGNPILIEKSVTIRVLATADDMIPAEGEAGTYTMMTTSEAYTQYIIQKIDPDDPESYEIPETLLGAGLDGIDNIIAALFKAIMDSPESAIAPFNYLNVEYFDIKIQFSADGKTNWVDATPENFPPEGVTISLSDETLAKHSEDLKDVDKSTNVFLASHMFVEYYGDWVPGDIEVLNVDETETALEFTVHGTSPMAVAWAVGQKPGENGGNNGGNSSGTDPANPNGTNDPNNNGGNANGADGSANIPVVASEAGTNQNGDNADSEDGIASKAKQLLSSLPITGDKSSLLLWSVLGAASLGILAFAIAKIRKRR